MGERQHEDAKEGQMEDDIGQKNQMQDDDVLVGYSLLDYPGRSSWLLTTVWRRLFLSSWLLNNDMVL